MRIAVFILVGILLDAAVWSQMLPKPTQDSIFFLDVGQGDAQLISVKDLRMLVDTGPTAAVVRELEEVLGPEERRLDLILVTHAEKDHFGGLIAVLEKYQVGAVLWNGRRPDEPGSDWPTIENEVRRRGIPLLRVRRGDIIRGGNLRIDILAPDLGLLGSGNLNEGSIVQRIRLGEATVLLMGDAGFATENMLTGERLRADVLKIGHHGSKNSSGAAFLTAVAPEISVIQVGARNTYGHPASEVFGRLADFASTTVFRTDEDGRIELRIEKEGVRVFTER